LAGDPRYGGQKEHPSFQGLVTRVCLHAESLSITHPVTREPLTLRAPLPADLRALLDVLGIALPGVV
jgi:23S rRNA pseudouridine955/2504/2580 synthase